MARTRDQAEEQLAAGASLEAEDEAEQGQTEATQAEEPTQKESGGATAYSHDRLIAESQDFLGQPSHVVAGALHGVDQAYLNLKEAERLVGNFLDREV